MGSDADFDEDERAMIATYRLVSEDAADQVRTILMAKRLGVLNAKFEDGQLKVFPIGWDKSPSVIDRVRLAAYDKIDIRGLMIGVFALGLLIGLFVGEFR